LESFVINTFGDADEVLILSTHGGPVSVDSGDGDDVIAVRGVSGPTAIETGDGSDRVNIGSDAGILSNAVGSLNGIAASLVVDQEGGGSDVLDLDDSADLAANVGIQLTATQLSGLGTASGIGYAGVEDLRIHLGAGADELVVLATHGGATRIDGNGGADSIAVRTIAGATTLHTHAGSDRVNVGSNAAPGSNGGGTVNGIGALLSVDLGPAETDVLDVDDSGDAAANLDGQLTATQLGGLGMTSGIAYAGVEDLRIHLGAGADELVVLETHGGATRIDGNGGGDTIHVHTISGPTDLFTGTGADTVNVGSLTPAFGGVVDAIGDGAGDLLRIDGGADGDTDRLRVDHSGEVADPASRLVVTATTLAGLGMAEPLEYL
ncbi:MAG: hypothetical protein L0227_18755, partial [Chloroflexi bacterium]|nr:hypothetical protein [Chloroflexota bacterium]